MAAVTLRERISERSPVENVILGAFTLIDLTPSYQSCVEGGNLWEFAMSVNKVNIELELPYEAATQS